MAEKKTLQENPVLVALLTTEQEGSPLMRCLRTKADDRDSNGDTMLSTAERSSCALVSELHDNFGSHQESLLMCAIMDGRSQRAKQLIQEGSSVDCVSEKTKHSLLTACEYTGNPTVARLLLRQGAKVNLSRPRIETKGNFPGYHETFNAEVYMLLCSAGEKLAYLSNAKLFFADFVKTKRIWFLQQAVTTQMLTTEIRNHVFQLEDNHLYRKVYTRVEQFGMSLQSLCKHRIRGHLLDVGSENLFRRIPRLNLPKPLEHFLLLEISLDLHDGDNSQNDLRAVPLKDRLDEEASDTVPDYHVSCFVQ